MALDWKVLQVSEAALLRCSYKKYSEEMQQILRRFKVQYTSAWVFSFKLAAHFQNTFLLEHLWRAACKNL